MPQHSAKQDDDRAVHPQRRTLLIMLANRPNGWILSPGQRPRASSDAHVGEALRYAIVRVRRLGACKRRRHQDSAGVGDDASVSNLFELVGGEDIE